MASNHKVFVPNILASFECKRCGDCCSVWEIPVDRDAYDRAVRLLGDDAALHLKIADACSHFGYARLCLFDGRCGFQDGNICRIHRDHGEAALFPECRKFPRILYRSPIALHCTASFACKATAALLKEPAKVRITHTTQQHLPFLAKLCDTTLDEQPCLCRGKAMTWEALFALEHGFLEILDETNSAEHALLTMIELANDLDRGDEVPLSKETVDRELVAARIDGFRELGSRFLLTPADADGQLAFVLDLVERRIAAGLHRGWELIPLEAVLARWNNQPEDERRQSFLADYRRFYLPAGEDAFRVLKNYLVCRVSCNPEFAVHDVRSALNAVAALVALVRAVALALAAAANAPVTAGVMVDAVRAVDTAFYHLPNFTAMAAKRRPTASGLLTLTAK